MTRVLVSGAGGPAGVAVIRSLLARDDIDVFAADMDRWASGLYLVAAVRRRVVPPALADEFVESVRDVVASDGIDVVVSTVDFELRPLALRRADGSCRAAGSDFAAVGGRRGSAGRVHECRTTHRRDHRCRRADGAT